MRASALVRAVRGRFPRAAKADDTSLKLQNEFYEKSHHPHPAAGWPAVVAITGGLVLTIAGMGPWKV